MEEENSWEGSSSYDTQIDMLEKLEIERLELDRSEEELSDTETELIECGFCQNFFIGWDSLENHLKKCKKEYLKYYFWDEEASQFRPR